MRSSKLVRLLFGWLAMISIIVTFQNCGSYQSAQTTDSKIAVLNSEASSGNGHGYGGKLYVTLKAAGRCDDGLNIESKILAGDDNRGLLMRWNCRDVNPSQQVTISLSSDQSTLSYNGIVFTLDSIALAPTPVSTPEPAATPIATPEPTPEPGPLMRNFVAGTKESCEASIVNTVGASHACSIGGGCSLDGKVPSSSSLSANPTLWGACIPF